MGSGERAPVNILHEPRTEVVTPMNPNENMAVTVRFMMLKNKGITAPYQWNLVPMVRGTLTQAGAIKMST